MSVYQLMYVSGGTRSFTQADIEEILETSRLRNGRLGITGLLLHGDGAFIQVLEGDEQKVKSLALRIKGDSRHRNFMVLLEHHVEYRAFARWQMGFKRLELDRPGDQAIFKTTRNALDGRISRLDGGIMLDTVLAFAGQDFLADT